MTKTHATTGRRLPLKALPAFERAASHLSFTAAATDLHVTHGAVSRQVKALEQHLGVALFRRLHRRVELTEAGAALLPAVRSALHVLEAGAAQVTPASRHGPLVVSCLASFMARWLIPRLDAFQARHPEIEVRLTASHAPFDARQNGIDVAIRVGAPPWPDGIGAQPFLAERIGPVCAPGLLGHATDARLAALRRHKLLHTETRPEAWSDWLRLVAGKGINAEAGPRFEHFYFLLEAAIAGLGVGIGPYPLVEADLRTGRLVAPFGFVPSGRAYTLLWPGSGARLPKVRAFRAWLVAAAQARGGKLTASSLLPSGSQMKAPK